MELRHLRYFVAVAEELHFRRAAERLHMSQPPLSQQIRRLEEDVGATLLVRNQRRVELTAAGQAYLARARDILAAVEDAAREARRVQRGEVGRLDVGFVGSAMYSVVPELLRAFRERFPDVGLHLRELGTTEQLRRLEDGRLDVGFLRPPGPRAGLSIETVLLEPVVAALPEDHPLAAAPELRIEDLAGEPLVLMTRAGAPGLRDALRALTNGLGDDAIVQEVTEMQTLVGLVAAHVGVSLVPQSLRALARAGVVYRDLAGDVPTVRLSAAWRTGDDSPVLAAFLELMARGWWAGTDSAAAPAEGERFDGGRPRH
jgi:DNA-binding transcriptional LysR family regulator